MTRTHVVHLLVGLLLAAVSFFGALYQVNESMADDRSSDGPVPRLICPLH